MYEYILGAEGQHEHPERLAPILGASPRSCHVCLALVGIVHALAATVWTGELRRHSTLETKQFQRSQH